MGAEGTLEAYTHMPLGPAEADRVGMVRNIQSDMGAMPGLATTPSVPHHLAAARTSQRLKAARQPEVPFASASN